MRSLFTALALWCASAFAGWTDVSSPIITVQTDCPACTSNATGYSTAPSVVGIPIWTWTTIDVQAAWGFDPETKVVVLSGIGLITVGNEYEMCDMLHWYRAKGDTTPYSSGGALINYYPQFLLAPWETGKRDNYTVHIPVRDGKFEFMWGVRINGVNAYPSYPTNCSFGNYGLPQMGIR